MKLDCTLETRYSEKKGTNYKVIVIKLTPTYEKLVFLDSAENALLEATKKNNYDEIEF